MPGEKLLQWGVLGALLLPYAALSFVSGEAVRESKLLVQGLGAAVALAGLAWLERRRSVAVGPTARGARTLAWVALALVAWCLASAAASAPRVLDALSTAPVLAAVALFLAGAAPEGPALARTAFPLLMVAGAASSLLATLQRFAGFLTLPLAVPEPRFLAAGLVGNPGDLGAALVFPGILLAEALASPTHPRRARLFAAVALALVLGGLGASAALGPFLALVGGALAPLLLAGRRRLVGSLLALLLLGAGLAMTEAGGRLVEKVRQLASGRADLAFTQRDIGALAAVEMVRARPLLGTGPGAFSTAFVPARIAAEERAGRRLVHLSPSGHFENAHSEPLTLAAECGVPSAVLAAAALAGLILLLIFRDRAASPHPAVPLEVLVALLAGFSLLCVSGFPTRLAVTSGPFAFVLGLAWRTVRPGRPVAGAPTRSWLLAAGALVLGTTAAARGVAVWLQADGESRLREAAAVSGAVRESLLVSAEDRLEAALALRPRQATALLALCSARRLAHDPEGARRACVASLRLEERGETDLNLGRLALESGDERTATALFVRAVWILPSLLADVPEDAGRAAIELEVREREAALTRGTPAPRLPAGYPHP
ncbi:MAG: hypothetical protein EDX89_14965 [Acidobacteria bacterium]|nr:MAG: hypothetical protein EDX89_14965 [Acidobacteriota bacterium]